MKPEDIGLAIVEAINSKDWGQIAKLSTEDIQLRLPPGMVFYGRQGIKDFFTQLEARYGDLTVVARRTYAGADFVIIEYDAMGTNQHGAAEEDMGIFVNELRDGKVSRSQLYLDTKKLFDS